ncbi:AI-2E family transporter [Pulveribacter suum]|uniref:Phytochrome sensor protein n=1 Tax=Pulveribacter suum TaxID=2116657 RepID=A0A2P1NL36_9BURK|nr:AI-2E family transporter [Pulveribacter suum]AVP57696.1 phytochrome sensor protein [Pulveribacter suum]
MPLSEASRPRPAPTLKAAGTQRPASTLDALVPSLRFMAGLVIAALVITGLYAGRTILVPLALAFLLSFVLDPLVLRLKRLGLPRLPAVILVVLTTLSVLGVGALFIGNEARQLSEQLPSYQTTIRNKLRGLARELRAPGMFDGAKRTLDLVQSEVEAATPKPAPGSAGRGRAASVQKVEVQPPVLSPAQQAMAAVNALSRPLTDAGLVLVFVVFILLDRVDLRDRLLRLWGANLHGATDAMDEAGDRITRYLTMQLLVNVSYGIPMAVGLWLIGVPGAFLWGALAGLMRFVPYVGAFVAAAFPLTLAFAVHPGWSLVLWTLGLIITLELISNNVIEPWLYGASTGLSVLSLIVAATFWAALWGPVGLIMSTPLTVCLLVIGRYLPQLAFLDVLLGSQPALDEPTRIYQRLLAGDADEAIELSVRQIEANKGSVAAFYGQVAVPVLRMAAGDHARVATPEHRLRLIEGMDAVLDDLQAQYPPAPAAAQAAPADPVLCMGGQWEVDQLGARMLAHALQLQGCPVATHARAAAAVAAQAPDDTPQADAPQVVCVVWLLPEPAALARQVCRRLRRRWPGVQIMLALWGEAAESPEGVASPLPEELPARYGADAVSLSLAETLASAVQLHGAPVGETFESAPTPPNEDERLQALQASGVQTSQALRQLCQHAAARAADIFDMPLAMVSLVGRDEQAPLCLHGRLPPPAADEASPHPGDPLPRALSLCAHVVASGHSLVVHDIARDARFAGNPALRARRLRFYAGVPLRDAKGFALGTLCLLDTRPRLFDTREKRLLQAMADDLMASWQGAPVAQGAPESQEASATVGQIVPQ